MKIGIITFWWSEDNYGQQLQCYALQKYLRDNGYDAFLIRYNSSNDYMKLSIFMKLLKALNPIMVLKYLRKCKKKKLTINENIEHNRYFSQFRRDYLVQSDQLYYTYDELKKKPPKADCYIVGSDQIWNVSGWTLKRFKNVLHAYFLDFGAPEIKRISYAACWGTRQISTKVVSEIRPLLAKFSAVSVREKDGISICTDCGYLSSRWVCDPTLLLSVSTYRKLYMDNVSRNPQKPYILFYYLDNGGKFYKKSVFNFAKVKKLQVEYITANLTYDSYDKNYATIPEWLSLVDNAKYIITNSYHCCVFSIIFNKQFGVIRLSGDNEGMNSRLENLFSMCNIEGRYITSCDFSVLDREYSLQGLGSKIKESKCFLLESLHE